MINWVAFREALVAQLVDIPSPAPLGSGDGFQMAVAGLTGALQATIQAAVPLTRPCPHSKRWWSRSLSDLKRKKNKLSSLSYRYRALEDHPAHEEHRQIQNAYSDKIRKAKQDHWDSFLTYVHVSPRRLGGQPLHLGPGRR